MASRTDTSRKRKHGSAASISNNKTTRKYSAAHEKIPLTARVKLEPQDDEVAAVPASVRVKQEVIESICKSIKLEKCEDSSVAASKGYRTTDFIKGAGADMEDISSGEESSDDNLEDISEDSTDEDYVADNGRVASKSKVVSIMDRLSSENEKLRAENNQLRETTSTTTKINNALLAVCERLTVLEEFIEVEQGAQFAKFMQNRDRLINVVGMEGTKDELLHGKRSSKSSELVGLLKLVKEQTSSNNNLGHVGASGGPPGQTQSTSRNLQVKIPNPPMPTILGSGGSPSPRLFYSGKLLQKTCKVCYTPGYKTDDCPCKYRTITQEDAAEIAKRKKAHDRALNILNTRRRACRKALADRRELRSLKAKIRKGEIQMTE